MNDDKVVVCGGVRVVTGRPTRLQRRRPERPGDRCGPDERQGAQPIGLRRCCRQTQKEGGWQKEEEIGVRAGGCVLRVAQQGAFDCAAPGWKTALLSI